MDAETIGKHLLTARVSRGFTQGQLAQASELHQGVISAMENGKRLPSIPQLLRVARVLEVSLQWFLTGSNTIGVDLPDLAVQLSVLGIADLHVADARVPGAFRSGAETIVLALAGSAPSARIIEAMPAVLAWNIESHFRLRAFADAYGDRIKYRLGWLADIALTIHKDQGFPGGCPNWGCLEGLSEVGYPGNEDSLGFAESEEQRPPVSLRWKMGYPAPLTAFRERAERLHRLRSEKMFRLLSAP